MRSVRQLLNQKGHDLISLTPDEPVYRAIELMAEHGIGSVLVMDGDELSGIATERDYARKVILQNRASRETPVRDIMSSPVITVTPDDRAQECMQTMTDKRIRHLPVEEDGQIIGVVSIGDLVKAVIEDQAEEIDELQRYIAT